MCFLCGFKALACLSSSPSGAPSVYIQGTSLHLWRWTGVMVMQYLRHLEEIFSICLKESIG